MFQYFFVRLKRKIRVIFTRAYQGSWFNFDSRIDVDKAVRALAVGLVLLTSLTAIPREIVDASRTISEKESEDEGGFVAGTVEGSNPQPAPMWPKNLADVPELEELTAEALLVLDSKDEKILLEKNGTLPMSPASLTKIMTAFVALEKYPLDKEFVVSEACLLGLEGKAHMNLQAGEKITMKNLLYGLLMHSAADAACVLARDPASVYDDSRAGEEAFIDQMNGQASDLGLENTSFTNTVGLDDEEHYATANDIMLLLQEVMKNRIFQIVVATREINLHDAGDPPSRWHGLKSTNDLLFELPNITGVKTGTTGDAGECLAASWIWEGREFYAILLGAEKGKRFKEMKRIIKWVEDSYEMEEN